MTMLPMYRTCPKCKKRYSWNPDVGKITCPRCMGFQNVPFSVLEELGKILKKKKE